MTQESMYSQYQGNDELKDYELDRADSSDEQAKEQAREDLEEGTYSQDKED